MDPTVNNNTIFEPIPLAKPWLGEEEILGVARTILSHWITQGPEVEAFENEFALFVGSKYACAVSSCTTALHLALLAVGVQPGDEVITVSHSFIGTANSILYCGARPVFVDIGVNGYNIDPEKIESAITPSTRAILCVHQMGMPCDLASILDIARRYGLKVIEDAACAIGSEILWQGKWEKIGKPHGDVACFSFHPRKLLTTGDGGMITSNDPTLDSKVRILRHHGMNVSDQRRHLSKTVIFEEYEDIGYNFRLTDLQAAVGRAQLLKIPKIVKERRAKAARYCELLAGTGIHLPIEPPFARSNWQSYCVGLPQGTHQLRVMQALLNLGIATRRGVMCIHREKAYQNLNHTQWRCGTCSTGSASPSACLQKSEEAQDRSILLPLYHEFSSESQNRVVSALKRELTR